MFLEPWGNGEWISGSQRCNCSATPLTMGPALDNHIKLGLQQPPRSGLRKSHSVWPKVKVQALQPLSQNPHKNFLGWEEKTALNSPNYWPRKSPLFLRADWMNGGKFRSRLSLNAGLGIKGSCLGSDSQILISSDTIGWPSSSSRSCNCS